MLHYAPEKNKKFQLTTGTMLGYKEKEKLIKIDY